ncbi:MAG: hypothetical protein HYW48_04305 [Deltaproteobacteria bacterium]|nr:hypothetical protein [Deltaproteobacteria bacterium]
MTLMILLLSVCFLDQAVLASSQDIEPAPEIPYKGRAWVVEAAGIQHHLKGTKDNQIEGVGSRLSLGYGKIQPLYFFFVNAELLLGPYNIIYRNVKVDYNASGLSLIGGSSVKNLTLRGEATSFGLLAGLGYREFAGKSIGRADYAEILDKTEAVIHYRNSVVAVETSFGVFFSWVKSQRPDSHNPELLLTRNDGLMLSLSFAIPVYSRYRSRVETFRSDEERKEELDKENDDPGPTKVLTQTGVLDGFQIILSLRAFLGT